MTTYKDYQKARSDYQAAKQELAHVSEEYLKDVISSLNLSGTVLNKKSGKLGVLYVEMTPYGSYDYKEINFYPFTKKGTVSLSNRNFGFYTDYNYEKIVNKLKEYFEPAGDFDAG